tara:strand:- start:87 stop:530 length:444 start_codon:yes stop_codon:yes gene_type:complete
MKSSKNQIKKYNAFSIFNKLLLFLPLLLLNFIDIPPIFANIFNHYIFYLFVFIILIILTKNHQFILVIFVFVLSYLLITKSFKATRYLSKQKVNEKNKINNLLAYNTNLLNITLEEDIIKHVQSNPLNTPDRSKVEPSECIFSKKTI